MRLLCLKAENRSPPEVASADADADAEDTISIASGKGNGDCGFVMENENRYVIYGNPIKSAIIKGAFKNTAEILSTDVCTRSRLSSGEEVALLSKISADYFKWWKFWRWW